MTHYTCGHCGETYRVVVPEAEAEAEYQRNFGHVPELAAGKRVVICDDCYRRLMRWWNRHPDYVPPQEAADGHEAQRA